MARERKRQATATQPTILARATTGPYCYVFYTGLSVTSVTVQTKQVSHRLHRGSNLRIDTCIIRERLNAFCFRSS